MNLKVYPSSTLFEQEIIKQVTSNKFTKMKFGSHLPKIYDLIFCLQIFDSQSNKWISDFDGSYSHLLEDSNFFTSVNKEYIIDENRSLINQSYSYLEEQMFDYSPRKISSEKNSTEDNDEDNKEI